MSNTRLSVNINKIALIRNSRGEELPDVIGLAQAILSTDSVGITVHPRPDGRHILPTDVHELKELIDTLPGKELNIEGNPYHHQSKEYHRKVADKDFRYPGFMELVLRTLPHQVTLVPDDHTQITSNHGWNITQERAKLAPLIKTLKDKNIRVSLFVDPDISSENLKIARELGSDRVELYTDSYAKLFDVTNDKKNNSAITSYLKTAEHALNVGLELNAGHALSQANLGYLVTNIPTLKEVSIGHALICESLEVGLLPTVEKYLAILKHSAR